MAQELEVSSITVSGLLDKLRSREWMIPAFQRDFVWSVADVTNLTLSILERRPIGMATLWQQPDESDLPLEPVSVPDTDNTGVTATPLAGADIPPDRRYAVLDGRQRCTAIAMVFGGLKSVDRKRRFSGRFFLDVTQTEDSKMVEFIKESEVLRRGLDTDSVCVGQGLFPLSSSNPEESLMQQFYRYTQSITDASNYPDSQLPEAEELTRRNQILARAFDGLMATKLAVYIVPSSYSLAEICEIFEVLNTTGTKVSTVDLIHSWLFSGTVNDDQVLLLREWIDALGQRDGAIGWASSTDRPELIAQMATACYVSMVAKVEEPRTVGRNQGAAITSIKSGDLLATPTRHWKHVIQNEGELTSFLGDFQRVVADGAFPWKSCPYPVTSSIYVGLRWHHRFDDDDTHRWEISDLNALFRAFFWRNALSSRYDQGFLTQLGKDIVELKQILNARSEYQNFSDWAEYANKGMAALMTKPVPDVDQIREYATGRQTGALQKALLLTIVAGSRRDLLNPEVDISYPSRTDVQLHHIYPSKWCGNNRTGALREFLDSGASDRDWVGSASNLMPLSRESNLEWRDANPGAILVDRGVTYERFSEIFDSLQISEQAFDYLLLGGDGIPNFWNERASVIAQRLTRYTTIFAS